MLRREGARRVLARALQKPCPPTSNQCAPIHPSIHPITGLCLPIHPSLLLPTHPQASKEDAVALFKFHGRRRRIMPPSSFAAAYE